MIFRRGNPIIAPGSKNILIQEYLFYCIKTPTSGEVAEEEEKEEFRKVRIDFLTKEDPDGSYPTRIASCIQSQKQ